MSKLASLSRKWKSQIQRLYWIPVFTGNPMIKKSQISMKIQKYINIPNPPLEKGLGGFSSDYTLIY
jgi:hypothetical protein